MADLAAFLSFPALTLWTVCGMRLWRIEGGFNGSA